MQEIEGQPSPKLPLAAHARNCQLLHQFDE
jgi:hypothetical protein